MLLTGVKTSIVLAMVSGFNALNPGGTPIDDSLDLTPNSITIEYPQEQIEWPAIFVQFRPSVTQWTGLDPDIYVPISGAPSSAFVAASFPLTNINYPYEVSPSQNQFTYTAVDTGDPQVFTITPVLWNNVTDTLISFSLAVNASGTQWGSFMETGTNNNAELEFVVLDGGPQHNGDSITLGPNDITSVVGFADPAFYGGGQQGVFIGEYDVYRQIYFEGSFDFTILAMHNEERDRLYDSMVNLIEMNPGSPGSVAFYNSLNEQQLVEMTINGSTITNLGDTVSTGTPWSPEELTYENTIRVKAVGETYEDKYATTSFGISAITASGSTVLIINEPWIVGSALV